LLAFSFRESTDFALTGTASVAASARTNDARRAARDVIKRSVDFISFLLFFLTASHR